MVRGKHQQYVLGLAGSSRLVRNLAPEMRKVRHRAKQSGQPARVFGNFAGSGEAGQSFHLKTDIDSGRTLTAFR